MADKTSGEHVHGTMDIRQQEKTFAGFIRLSVYVIVVAIAILIFMALTNA
jgi:hypothetical protein